MTVTRLGLLIRYFTYPGVSDSKLFELIANIARSAETSGFDSVWVMDHVQQVPFLGSETDNVLEATTLAAALAARTETASIGILVAGVTYRHPAVLAKAATTIDTISAGRAILGLGAAWWEPEHISYGISYPNGAERLARLDEAIQITRKMIESERSYFDGSFYSLHGAINNPRPIHGRLPLLVGGNGEKVTLRLVAKYADASNFFADSGECRRLISVLERHCDSVGRDPGDITKTRLVTLILGETNAEAKARLNSLRQRVSITDDEVRHMVVAGDQESVRQQLAETREAGIDAFIIAIPDIGHREDAISHASETLLPVVEDRPRPPTGGGTISSQAAADPILTTGQRTGSA
jgi:F420-dependent oxidoreductase-like protein